MAPSSMHRDDVVRSLVTDRAKLLAYAWAIVRDEHGAEDLYQDTLIAAMNSGEPFADATHLARWARATLRNKALGHLRKQRTKPTALAGDVLDLMEGHWASYDGVATAEMSEALRGCLSHLTPNARELIELRYGKGMSGTAVAKATQRRPHAVYVALSRAYKQLGDCINGKLFAPGVPGAPGTPGGGISGTGAADA